jgi:hypothetical protein
MSEFRKARLRFVTTRGSDGFLSLTLWVSLLGLLSDRAHAMGWSAGVGILEHPLKKSEYIFQLY